MIEYININDKSPILHQVSPSFKSGALLFHPFVQMPSGWTNNKRENPYQHIYPNDKEILNEGKPISWEEMMAVSGIKTKNEIALALMSSGALNEKYARNDLADKLLENTGTDVYYPTEDNSSVFLIHSLLEVLGSKGAENLSFSDPIFDQSGYLSLKEMTPLDICNLSAAELIVADENKDYAFMSVYDSFTTLFLAKEDNIEDIIQLMEWEAFICTEETMINWFLNDK